MSKDGIIADINYIVQNSGLIIPDLLSKQKMPDEVLESSKILEDIFLQIEESKTPMMDVFRAVCSNYKTELGENFRPLRNICQYHDNEGEHFDSAYHSRFHHAKVMLSALILTMTHEINDPDIINPLFFTASVHDLWYKSSVETAKKKGITTEQESIETAFDLSLLNVLDFSFEFINEINSATIFPAPIQYSKDEKTRKIQELLSTADLMPSLGISTRLYFRETMRVEKEINMTLDAKARYDFVTMQEVKKRILPIISGTIFDHNYKNICNYAENMLNIDYQKNRRYSF